MPATAFPFQMVGGVPVVTAPAEIDSTTAVQLRTILSEWHTRGHTTVVVDMTGTEFCDSAGLGLLVRAHKRAAAGGGGLRMVIPADSALMLVFTLTGVDRVIPHFASLAEALSQAPAPALRRPRPGPPSGSPTEAAGSPAEAREQGPVADTRACEQCGTAFVPQREHARFCSVGCRAAWNREHMGDPAVEASALQWSVTAMSEAAGRLPVMRVWDQPRALAAVGEAVWWITMVDATLVRHHRDVYDAVLAAHDAAERRLTEATLAGLRFVRNWIGGGAGLEELIEPEGAGTGYRRITRWTWKPASQPALGGLPARGRAWETARYRAYQAQLAGHTIGETFRRTLPFLTLTGANAASTMVIGGGSRR